jgi:hypothetical protein
MPPPIQSSGKNEPTIGRRIWYRPLAHERTFEGGDQPFDAGICYVHPDGTVNLDVKNELGSPLQRHDVTVAPSYDEAKPGQCGWMPYQVGQAKAAG